MNKRCLSIFLAVALLIALSACGRAADLSPVASSFPEPSAAEVVSAPAPSPSESPTPDYSEDKEMYRVYFGPVLRPAFGEDFSITKTDSEILVQVWSPNAHILVEDALSGDSDALQNWNVIRNAFPDIYDYMRSSVLSELSSGYSLRLEMIEPGAPEVLYLVEDDSGIILDAVNDILDERLLAEHPNANLSDEERYTAAYDAIVAFYSEQPGVVNGSALNLDFSPNGHPWLAVTINYHEDYYSPFSFQSLVLDTINVLSEISYEYYIEYDDVAIDFRFQNGQDSISYRVLHTEDLFVGNIEDSYNHVSGRDVPAAQINAWYSSSEFLAKYAEANSSCTYEEYLSIEIGMSYEEVVRIVGSDGEQLSSVAIGGHTSTLFSWDGAKEFSSIVVTFQDGKVVSKAQFGLD